MIYREAREFKLKVEGTILELQSSQSPKGLDYEIKEGLRQKEKTSLLFRKFCDYQKYQLFH